MVPEASLVKGGELKANWVPSGLYHLTVNSFNGARSSALAKISSVPAVGRLKLVDSKSRAGSLKFFIFFPDNRPF